VICPRALVGDVASRMCSRAWALFFLRCLARWTPCDADRSWRQDLSHVAARRLDLRVSARISTSQTHGDSVARSLVASSCSAWLTAPYDPALVPSDMSAPWDLPGSRGIVTCHCYAHRRAPSVRGPAIAKYTCFHHLDVSCNTSHYLVIEAARPALTSSLPRFPDPAAHRQPG
jgi:hypothetical protein